MSASQLIANRFEIKDLEQDLLGRGGMGDVYRARDAQTGETVAVKALNPGVVARDPEILERFVREGQALRQATGSHVGAGDRPDHERNLSSLRAQLDQATFEAAWAGGAALTLEQTVALAMGEG